MKDVLKSAFDRCKIHLDDQCVSTQAAFYQMLVEWNEKFNLTRIISPEDAAIKHFCDSLLGAEFISGRVCDVGSGGGFPAIPLAIAKPDCHFTLVEANGKKVSFLQAACDELDLKNARVIKARAEEIPELRESFDVVTARAVAALNTLLEYCLPLVKVGGRFVAYKGAGFGEELLAAQNAISVLGGRLLAVHEFELPDGSGSRAIIEIEKVSNTPAKYPRGQGKPRSKPL